jgi:hypothetical protein
MALPTNGITTSLVGQAIGTSSRKVNTLCSHSNINKWSRWKPIPLAKVTGITDLDLIENGFGLTYQWATNINSVLGVQGFEYVKPQGGATSPFRLGDFRKYNHDAIIPIGTGENSSPAFTIKKGSAQWQNENAITSFRVNTTPANIYEIGYQDLYPISLTKGLYLGVHLTNSIGEKYWMTMSETLQSLNLQQRISVYLNWNVDELRDWVGVVVVNFFVTTVKRIQGQQYTPSTNDSFYPIPSDAENINPYSVQVTNAYEYIQPSTDTFYVRANVRRQSYNSQTVLSTITFSTKDTQLNGGLVEISTIEFYNFINGIENVLASDYIKPPFTIGDNEEVIENRTSPVPISGGSVYYRLKIGGKYWLSGVVNNG